jgi:hypothetical protein
VLKEPSDISAAVKNVMNLNRVVLLGGIENDEGAGRDATEVACPLGYFVT